MNSPAADPEVLLQSPIRSLFTGRVPEDLLFPYPGGLRRGARDRLGLPRLLPRLRPNDHIDSRRVEKEHGFSEDVIRGLAELGAFGMIDPGGLRRIRVLDVGLLPRHGGDRDDRRVARDPDRRPSVDRHEGARALRHGGAEGEVAAGARRGGDDRRLRAHRAGGRLRRRLDQDDGRVRREDGHVRPERHQALDLERRLREVLHGLRPRRPARRGGRAPRDHGVRRHAGPRAVSSPAGRSRSSA